MIKRIAEIIAPTSVAIIILGIIKQIFYYNRFNLPIKHYLSITEIGILFSDDMILISFFLLAAICVILLDEQSDKNQLRLLNKKEEIREILKSSTGLRNFFKFMPTLIYFVCFLAGTICLFYPSYKTLITGTLLLIAGVTNAIFFSTKKYNLNNNVVQKIKRLFLLIAIFSTITILSAALESQVTINGRYKGTQIITDDSTYISTESSFYIGRTDKYIFIYNKFDSITDIIPSDKIKKIRLKSVHVRAIVDRERNKK